MKFSLNKSLEIIENTPLVISALLNNLSDDWTTNNEGENTWTAKEVVAHLVVCEDSDWLPRIRIILSDSQDKTLAPVDMKTHLRIAENNTLQHLIKQFKQLREYSINEIKSLNLQETDFLKTAHHPVIGEVSLQQIISTWVTHDLTHLAQISRVMAKQYKTEVGPFKEFLSIL